MSQSAMCMDHRGPMSVATATATKQQLDAFRNALLKEAFVLKGQSPHYMEFYRRPRVFQDDWPMTLRIEQRNRELEVRCWMFIPWSWIAIFALLIVIFLPVAGASGVPPLLLFGLGLAVITFAIAKRRFDLSPDALWQSRPRKRWNEILGRLLANAFGVVAAKR